MNAYDRSIIHLNVADFAVAVERAVDCRLKGRPIIIAPEGAARSAVYDMSEEAYRTGIRKGIKTKVNGCWAVIDGQDVFMAAKVKQGDSFEFKVRLTKDGKPFWSMSPEELAKERSSN